MKKTAVEYLVKEFSEILGKIKTQSMEDLLLVDAINQAKEMEKEQINEAYANGSNDRLRNFINEQYYNETFK